VRKRFRSVCVSGLILCALTVAGGAEAALRRLPPTPPSASPHAFPPGSPAVMLARIRGQLATRRRRLAQIAQLERGALAQLSWARERLEQAETRLRQTTAALLGTRHAVAQAAESLQAVSHRLAVHETLMDDRLRTFYEQGPLGYLDVLLGAADFRDFIMRTYLIGRIIQQDLRLYRNVAAERVQEGEVRAALEARQSQLTVEQQRWIAGRRQTARLAAEHERLLERVRAERRGQEEAIRELEAESARITAIIHHAELGHRPAPVPTLGNRTLAWPVVGRITSGYGWRTHPIFRSREFHTGIDIAAPWGTPVRAAADGTVLFTGWMRGYGMLVILDHGGGVSTTYSHLSSYAVHVGDHVGRGEVIARIGSTGWSTGPHLFFEVREDGRPVNPLER
jgi:murein DD-endopeptidase MepM/ murein hydrolase activator NlpD